VCKAHPVGPISGEDRLVVALDATPLLGVQTGVGVFCREALAALGASHELDVEAFAISWRRRHLLDALVPRGVMVAGRAMPARPLHLAWRHTEQPPIEWFVGSPDVVHGTNFVVPPARSAARVVTVHDLTTVRFPEMCDAPTLRFPALIRRAVAHGAWVHTPSQYVADEVVAELGVDRERVRAVHHGTPRLSPAPEGDPIVLLGLPEGTTRYVLALGTAEPRKDLPGLVRAFDAVSGHLRDVALVLAGPPGWGSWDLQGAIGAARARSRIVTTGYVPNVDPLLRGAALLAYPSLYEGFGLPTLEAMASEVPVVTTTAGALPEVVGDAALMVGPGDTDALAAALELVLTDETERCSLIERGRVRASQFTWEKCARGLTDLYEEAAAK
jgi:glycosyltransferase involved in cell wall biosynthesis